MESLAKQSATLESNESHTEQKNHELSWRNTGIIYHHPSHEVFRHFKKRKEWKSAVNFEMSIGKETKFIPHTHPPLPLFYGCCYICDYEKHNQNFCPLRYCLACRQYGHSDKVCQSKKIPSQNWREK